MKKFFIILFIEIAIFFVAIKIVDIASYGIPDTIVETNDKINEADISKLDDEYSKKLSLLYDYDVDYKKTVYRFGKYKGFYASISTISNKEEIIDLMNSIPNSNLFENEEGISCGTTVKINSVYISKNECLYLYFNFNNIENKLYVSFKYTLESYR